MAPETDRVGPSDPRPTGRRGRPRRFDDATERRRLLDAAMELQVARNDSEVSIAEILDATGLSTRSFYRHFESKDALHLALLRREIASVVNRLSHLVEAAADPGQAVAAWIDGFLETFVDPRLAARSVALTSQATRSESPLPSELDQIRDEICAPLATALRRGHATGALTSPDPDLDARCVFGVLAMAATATTPPDRAAVRAQVIRFTWPALRLDSR